MAEWCPGCVFSFFWRMRLHPFARILAGQPANDRPAFHPGAGGWLASPCHNVTPFYTGSATKSKAGMDAAPRGARRLDEIQEGRLEDPEAARAGRHRDGLPEAHALDAHSHAGQERWRVGREVERVALAAGIQEIQIAAALVSVLVEH